MLSSTRLPIPALSRNFYSGGYSNFSCSEQESESCGVHCVDTNSPASRVQCSQTNYSSDIKLLTFLKFGAENIKNVLHLPNLIDMKSLLKNAINVAPSFLIGLIQIINILLVLLVKWW